MRFIILASALVTLASCHDGRTWESDTNGPEAQMAPCNKHTDIEQVPANNRTGNPEYHLRMEAEGDHNPPASNPQAKPETHSEEHH